MDLIPEEERAAMQKKIVTGLKWKGPVFAISALAGLGLTPLVDAVGEYFKQLQKPEPEPESEPE